MKKIERASTKSTPHITPKFILTLKLTLSRNYEGLNQLEASNLYGETCLHSTISTLANNHGIVFRRTREPHKHRGGGKTHFMRYRLKSADRALKLLQCYLGSDV